MALCTLGSRFYASTRERCAGVHFCMFLGSSVVTKQGIGLTQPFLGLGCIVRGRYHFLPGEALPGHLGQHSHQARPSQSDDDPEWPRGTHLITNQVLSTHCIPGQGDTELNSKPSLEEMSAQPGTGTGLSSQAQHRREPSPLPVPEAGTAQLARSKHPVSSEEGPRGPLHVPTPAWRGSGFQWRCSATSLICTPAQPAPPSLPGQQGSSASDAWWFLFR